MLFKETVYDFTVENTYENASLTNNQNNIDNNHSNDDHHYHRHYNFYGRLHLVTSWICAFQHQYFYYIHNFI